MTSASYPTNVERYAAEQWLAFGNAWERAKSEYERWLVFGIFIGGMLLSEHEEIREAADWSQLGAVACQDRFDSDEYRDGANAWRVRSERRFWESLLDIDEAGL